jgi:hypothetical protein
MFRVSGRIPDTVIDWLSVFTAPWGWVLGGAAPGPSTHCRCRLLLTPLTLPGPDGMPLTPPVPAPTVNMPYLTGGG